MNNIEKIILAGHPLREYGKYVTAWLPNLVNYQIKSVTNLPIYTLVPPNFKTFDLEENLIKFDYVKFAKFYGKEYSKNTWGELYYNEEFNEDAYNYVKSIFANSLVISYEMDACLLRILDYFKIPYIDMYISPIRFLEDQLFSMTTNNEKIYNKILDYKMPEELIYLHANYLSTGYRQMYFGRIQTEPAVLFIGQTAFDRALINPETGEIYSILNHKKEFENAIKGYKKIYYKRHPKASNDSPILEYLKTLANVEITKDNFYSMCSRPDIKKVVAISSGGLIEAKYFGKETEHLLHPSVNLQYGNEFDKEKYINIYEHFFSFHYWADILSPVIKTKDYPKELGFYGSKNKLRNSRGFRDWWGYQDFDHEMLKLDLISSASKNQHPNNVLAAIARTIYHINFDKNVFNMYQKFKQTK